MKQLQKSDLKEGEIYKQLELNYIFLYNSNEFSEFYNDGTAISTYAPAYYKCWCGNGFKKPMVEATPEEKHWLKECIKADKFVSYKDAMKTFIPEYVECIIKYVGAYNSSKIGKIYKTSEKPYFSIFNWKEVLSGNTFNYFKPSTKEAYEAQFKKSEFVLPEIWWVRITEENLEDVYEFLGFKPNEKGIGNIVGMCKQYRTGKIEKGWNPTPTTVYGSTFGDEITTEQFRKYVLKIENENTSKFINDTTVINKEGEVFKVGDIIKSINSNLKDKIIDFRWKNDKSEICAVLPNIPNGIGIDKIELCVEPKVEPKQELSLLEQAKLRYPIGTKFINAYKGVDRGIQIIDDYPLKEANLVSHGRIGVYWRNEWLYFNDQWAEIVEDFVLPEKWCVKVTSDNNDFINSVRDRSCTSYTYITSKLIIPDVKNSWLCSIDALYEGFVEITLEQFKKYVLNETL